MQLNDRNEKKQWTLTPNFNSYKIKLLPNKAYNLIHYIFTSKAYYVSWFYATTLLAGYFVPNSFWNWLPLVATMASDSGFDGGQENRLLITPVSSVMDRLRRLRDGLIFSPRQVNTPVTSPRIRSFSETPDLSSNYKPSPLNDSIVLISSIQLPPQQQIILHRVTLVMLLYDEPPTT